MSAPILSWRPKNWPVMRLRTLLELLACYFALDALAYLLDPYFHVRRDAEFMRALNGAEAWMLLVFCGAYGMHRIVNFHPRSDQSYKRWLITTPWHPGQRLPLGPITLGWPDALLLAGAAALGFFHNGLAPTFLVKVFACSYLLMTFFSLLGTGPEAAVYALAFGFAGVVRFWRTPWSLALLLCLYIVGHVALTRSLHGFPWESQTRSPEVGLLGWPFNRLGPRPTTLRVSTATGILISLLIGAWAYVLAWFFSLGDVFTAQIAGLVFAVAAILALIRYGIYAAGYHTPLGLIARVWTGHLIILRYDKI